MADVQFKSPTGSPITGILKIGSGAKAAVRYNLEPELSWESQIPRPCYGRLEVFDDQGTVWYLDECRKLDILTDQFVFSNA